jgi:hypothetical protein
MAKKRPKPTTKPTDAQKAEAERILGIWKAAADAAMGGKHFESAINTRYEPRLRKSILTRLMLGDIFDSAAEANTKQVATDLGAVCVMLTLPKEKSVNKDTFQRVFFLMKSHPLCPGKAGTGAWCDIPL